MLGIPFKITVSFTRPFASTKTCTTTVPSIPASCAISGYFGLIGLSGTGGSSYGINFTRGPSGGGGGASQASNSSKVNSSNVTSSAISSLSDSTGTDGLAGGGGRSNYSVVGNYVYSIGSDPDPCRYVGINVDRIRFSLFVFSAVIAAFGGLILLSQGGTAQPRALQGAELDIIAIIQGA